MINDKEIKQFVRETLGCTCPDEVLQHIECQADVNASDDVLLDYEINVGNKLLIFVDRLVRSFRNWSGTA